MTAEELIVQHHSITMNPDRRICNSEIGGIYVGTPEKERQPKPVLEWAWMRNRGAHKPGYAVTGKSSNLGHGL
ncbi:hypothetical protein KBY93_15910, partial [Synechococcus sp. J7-Johnson]|uniref:hypothetical protein n=1 Tax=Synechococcus sp. J7-Johnson TaxID=2823737 RepID=UPI0020CD2AD9